LVWNRIRDLGKSDIPVDPANHAGHDICFHGPKDVVKPADPDKPGTICRLRSVEVHSDNLTDTYVSELLHDVAATATKTDDRNSRLPEIALAPIPY